MMIGMQERLQELRELNKELKLYSIHDEAFAPYGKVLDGYDWSGLLEALDQTAIPEDGNVYVGSAPELESFRLKEELAAGVYGGMDVQIGYCNGRNSTLNGLEYHKCSEINVGATDLVLLLGKVQSIRSNTFEAAKVEGFYIPRGTAVELYATTLHFAPCKVDAGGFKCAVVLLRGTNEPLPAEVSRTTEEDQLLFMRNKWLLAHPERKLLMDRGAYPGIDGPNIEVRYPGV
ncbi:DUF4867 family protein [Paenibacillus sp. YYML68]|uniref:DUF4867 family protein n=1 Tax=Paenibacillus sp. YYML68 TaxID=2909250 RepID=UPI0024919677|nr:DUF4867 family protein [Paenibacillus sp. YYML68]